jgi:hypothetical protein
VVASSRFKNRLDEDYSSDEADQAEEQTSRAGIALLAAGSLLAGVLVILAILYAGNFDGWRNVPESPPSSASAADAQLAAAAHRYLAVADPGNQQLAKETAALTASERSNLAAARADLKAEVATASRFDRQLAAIKFPAAVEPIARDVVRANQALGRVTARQARARTLTALQALDARRTAAAAAVEAQVKRLRLALHLPAPSSG